MSIQEVVNCWTNNSDGAGMAWVEGGKVHVRKGFMTLEEFIAAYSGINVLPHVVHFRIGTSGPNCAELTHPFVISKESPLDVNQDIDDAVLFHNGVFSDWKEMSKSFFFNTYQSVPEGPFNDTRALAIVLNTLGYNALTFVDGRFVVMTPKGIDTFGTWEEEEGIMFSNSNFRWATTYNYGRAGVKEAADYWSIGGIPYITKEGEILDPEAQHAIEEEGQTELGAQEDDGTTSIVVQPGTQPQPPTVRERIDIEMLEAADALGSVCMGA
jgi:predicted glutamine amidotransferase